MTLTRPASCLLLASFLGCSDPPSDVPPDASTDLGPGRDAAADSGSAPLAEFTAPDAITSLSGIAVDPDSGEFFVGSGQGGQILTGAAGATASSALRVRCDLGGAGVSRTGALAFFRRGDERHLAAVGAGVLHDIRLTTAGCESAATITLTGALLTQSVAVTPDGRIALVTAPLSRDLVRVDLESQRVDQISLGEGFPLAADPAIGFINGTGVTIAADGRSVIVGHLIDKHLFRLDLGAVSAGATRIDTGAANFSGNGLARDGDQLVQLLGDEQKVAVYTVNADATQVTYRRRVTPPDMTGNTGELALHRGVILVVVGVSGTFGGLMLPAASDGRLPGFPLVGDGGLPFPAIGDAAVPTFPNSDGGGVAGPPRVIQVRVQ